MKNDNLVELGKRMFQKIYSLSLKLCKLCKRKEILGRIVKISRTEKKRYCKKKKKIENNVEVQKNEKIYCAMKHFKSDIAME